MSDGGDRFNFENTTQGGGSVTMGGDVTGPSGASTVAAIDGVPVDLTAHAAGDVLELNGTNDKIVSAPKATPGLHHTTHELGGADQLAIDGSQITAGNVALARIATALAAGGGPITGTVLDASVRMDTPSIGFNGSNQHAPPAGTDVLLSAGSTATVSNKSIDGGSNTLTNLPATNLTGQIPSLSVEPAIDVQVFAASGTWTKPAGARLVHVVCIGPGGGGGSGRRGAATSFGGGGGGGGGYTQESFLASLLGSSVAVVIGTGGAGGAAQTADSTDGNDGVDGSSNSSFGVFLKANLGAGGKKGTATTGTSGGAGAGGSSGGAGGAGAAAAGGSGIASITYGAGGGGAGGGFNGSANAGGQVATNTGINVTSPNPGGVAPAGNGNNGNATGAYQGGQGGSGGASASDGVTAAGRGGGGALYGAGGGGGGASANGANSGAGGAGGAGVVVVVSW